MNCTFTCTRYSVPVPEPVPVPAPAQVWNLSSEPAAQECHKKYTCEISKGKLEGGDVTYLSCVPALFLLTANLFASQSARLLWPDRDLAVKWQQNILLIAEIATT